MEHLVAKHGGISWKQVFLQLEVIIVYTVSINVDALRVEGPTVWPQKRCPARGVPGDDKTNIVHPSIPVSVNVEAGGHLGANAVHCVREQLMFPIPALHSIVSSSVANGVGGTMVWLEVAPWM